jgi:hypothetical protein
VGQNNKPDPDAERRDVVLRRMLATPKAPIRPHTGATYAKIQAYVREQSGFTPKSCWVAHVLFDHGRTRRTSPNRIDNAARVHPCPDSKRPAIEAALRHFGMI